MISKFINLVSIAICLLPKIGCSQKISVASPDRKLVFSLTVRPQRPVYTVLYAGKLVVEESEIGLTFNGTAFGEKLHRLKPQFRNGVEDYQLVVGKASRIKDEYREVIIPLVDQKARRQVNVVVRAFNDGVAFRYQFVKDNGSDSLRLDDEASTFRFPAKTVAHFLPLPGYTTSHEGYYSSTAVEALRDGALMDMPALFALPNGIFFGITEAALVDYAGMYLTKSGDALRSMLSPLPGHAGIKVMAALPHVSPWRVLLVGEHVGTLMESNMLTDLCPPQAIADVTWLKPGKTTFPWWNGNVLPDTLNAPGNNFVTQKHYIDFCARHHLEYHSVVEYGLHQWYVDDGISFMPGPHSDPTRAVPGLDMKAVCDYAKARGVGVRVWVHWASLYPKIDSAFANYERWGLQGMMVDFMDRDDQAMVNIQNEMLRKAAQHHLHIQFHGAYKPTGLHRTYPNELTREGTLNYEINKWDPHGLPPDQDVMIPFTRMLAGSTDYHLGGFRAVPPQKFVTQYTRPLMLGTRAHMMAMYVVLENYLGMVCDYPDAYIGQPGFDFVASVPTTWDETKVLDARVGEYVVIARRKGADWYIGAITNHESRSIQVSLSFLGRSKFRSTQYGDATDVDEQPNHIDEKTAELAASDQLTLNLAAGGGAVVTLRHP